MDHSTEGRRDPNLSERNSPATPTRIGSWTEHDEAVGKLFDLAAREICILDADLRRLAVERPAHHAALRRLLSENPKHQVRILVSDASGLVACFPRLTQLCETFSHNLQIASVAEDVVVSDCVIVVDRAHALVRFHRDHVRGKVILDDPREVSPYLQRFEDLWSAGAVPMASRPLGL